MESFKSLVGNVMQKSVPDRAGLLLICSQLEAWDAYSHDTQMIKSMGMHAIVRLNESELGKDEDMLRLYQIVGKHSRNMGAARIYDNLDTRGTFKSSLKFHLLWAESHAKQGDLKKFCEVIDHARNRLAHIDKTDLEAGFRDQADKYFSDVKHIFTDDEETAGIFAVKDKNDGRAKKSRRRSSLAVIQEKAVAACKFTSTSSRHGSFGENTKTPLRFEIIDRPFDGYLAPSIEEYRVAQMEAAQDMLDVIADVPMDITVIAQENVFVEQKAHPIVSDITASCTHIQSKILPQGDSAHVTHEKESIPRRPRQLSTLEEVDYDTSSEEKRRRILSPKQAVKESTRPSSTNVNKSLQVRPSTKQPKSPLLTGSSFTEKAYNDLKAVFSDTVDLNKGPLEGVVDESTMQLAPKPAENFEVFIDSDVSVQIVKNISEVPIGKEIPEK
uniref:BUB1 N-terminal domain-containing protein n=1 Tax=Heterorhabditis bacteriophora TaxID=37862 RepID=A0A1I7WVG8_HETBA